MDATAFFHGHDTCSPVLGIRNGQALRPSEDQIQRAAALGTNRDSNLHDLQGMQGFDKR
jgi:hypothetical protein